MSFKIEKNVAPDAGLAVRKAKYPWRQMQVGDSFVIPESERPWERVMSNVSSCGRAIHGKGSVTARRVEGGIRFWRIA